ncbi:MAG: tRNA (adenosine(37)-N6)-dimethylallyltransferase MiaA [Deltaproteobacteria bacterium]|nr:tRNA (adenosine(37)-N6)-dimethylallyltransferase MiaA [Deltaproteobacteria bacterium]MBW2067682.1 tRNA (adenosine(37)-N6)-dimethylallyltransferase MiaA [Deltaproteobacteria bacterium]
MTDKPFVVVIAGPTAVGKTETALTVAEKFGMEIVNADSMQVYRYMNIGTAKPNKEEQRRVRHHLIDVVNPDEHFDAGMYKKLADATIQDLWNRGVVPLIVGGTGLYIRVLMRGICGQIPRNESVLKKLKEKLKQRGISELYGELTEVDPLLARRIHHHDRQRILRALEVYHSTGKPLSQWQEEHRFSDRPYRSLKIFLTRDRKELYERINNRTEKMFRCGLVEEVQMLLEMGYSPELKSMQALGYKETVAYLHGHMSLDDAIRTVKKETRRYAKRQFTWFRKEPGFRWLEASNTEKILNLVDGELQNAGV